MASFSVVKLFSPFISMLSLAFVEIVNIGISNIKLIAKAPILFMFLFILRSFLLLQNYITFLSIIKNNINKYLHYKSEHKKIYKSGYFYILKIRVYFKP